MVQIAPRHRPYTRVFFLTLLVTALARGAAFLPAYSIDDYMLALQDAPVTSMARDGRFGEAALVQILHLLQLRPQYARTVFVGFAIVVWAFLATVVIRHWRVRPHGWLPVAAASVIAVHPFSVEFFTFRTALATCTVALALLVPVLVPGGWSRRRVLAGSAWFALALSVYQVVLHFGVMLVLMGVAIGLSRLLATGSESPQPERLKTLLSWSRLVRNRNSGLLGCVALGTVGYGLIIVLLAKIFDVAMKSRTELLSPSGVRPRVRAVATVLWDRFVVADGFLTQTAKGLLWLLLLASLASLLMLAMRRLTWRSAAIVTGVLGLLAAALVWTVGIPMVLKKDIWPVARVMSHTGLFWAGILVIAHRCAGTWGRRLLGGLSLLVVLSFIGGGNRILHDQVRLNGRDAAKANRIVGRLEALPGFSGNEVVAVHGRDWRYPLSYATWDHDMNLSAFGADWAQVPMLQELSGYRFGLANPEQLAIAEAYCRQVPPWPAPQSVTIADGLAIVCLEHDG